MNKVYSSLVSFVFCLLSWSAIAQTTERWYIDVNTRYNVILGKTRISHIYFCCNETRYADGKRNWFHPQNTPSFEFKIGRRLKKFSLELAVDISERQWREFSANVYFISQSTFFYLPDGSQMNLGDTTLFNPTFRFSGYSIGILGAKEWDVSGWKLSFGVSKSWMKNAASSWSYNGVLETDTVGNFSGGINNRTFFLYHLGLEKRMWRYGLFELLALLKLSNTYAFRVYSNELPRKYYTVAFPFWLETGLGLTARINFGAKKEDNK